MKTKIYVLIDPRDGAVRYVGKTVTRLETRLSSHCSEARNKGGTHKLHWIRDLLDSGARPLIEILDTVDGDGALEEIKAIQRLREEGELLTNTSIGGTAPMLGRHHSIEARLKMAASRAGRPSPMQGKKHSEKSILKMKARRNNYSEEESQARAARLLLNKSDPEFETRRLAGLAKRGGIWLKNVSEACRRTAVKRKQQRFFKLLTSSIKARF